MSAFAILPILPHQQSRRLVVKRVTATLKGETNKVVGCANYLVLALLANLHWH